MANTRKDMQKRHQPFHLYMDKQIYFLSVHTYQNVPILKSVKRKSEFEQKLKEITVEKRCNIIAWVILDNHYHFIMKTDKGKDIRDIFKTIHGTTSFQWNKEDGKKGRKIWQSYWDYCIRGESDYWTRFNYIHHNPVKHCYVKRMEDYEFSSFNFYVKTKGYEWLMSVFEKYPVVDYTMEGDDR
jgi:putative transposase